MNNNRVKNVLDKLLTEAVYELVGGSQLCTDGSITLIRDKTGNIRGSVKADFYFPVISDSE